MRFATTCSHPKDLTSTMYQAQGSKLPSPCYRDPMKRFIWPLLFFATTAYMYKHNTTESSSVMMLPMMDLLFPSTAGDPHAMGMASVKTMAVISTLALIYETGSYTRYRRQLRAYNAAVKAQEAQE